MLQPGQSSSSNDRRTSNNSASSIRSFSQDAISSISAAAIAQDREANMRTPRPHTASAIAERNVQADRDREETAALLSAAAVDETGVHQWQQRREASENTLDARTTSPEHYYPSDSLGRISVASSAFTSGAASDFGHSLRSASDAGTEWSGIHPSASGSAARRARKIAPPELLVVVRPPPSKQTNPLNLQIQLLTPQTNNSSQQSGAGRISGESSRDETGPIPLQSTSVPPISANALYSTNGNSSSNLSAQLGNATTLRRSNSVTSSRSAMSESSSTAYSITSASSSSRRVTPLYNLCFHSIVATTVTDAGTDQKVAKFNKRGVEIDGFGTLMPHELMLGVNDLASIEKRRRSTAALSTNSGTGEARMSVNGDGRKEVRTSLAPTSDSGGSNGIPLADQSVEPPTSFDAMSPQAREMSTELTGGLGGKLMRGFKRLSLNPATAAPVGKPLAPPSTSVRSSVTADSSASSGIIARLKGAAIKVREGEGADDVGGERLSGPDALQTDPSGAGGSEIPQLVVGAGIRSDGSRRSHGYFWTVNRWTRRSGDDPDEIDNLVPGRREAGSNPILNSVWKRFNVVNRMGGGEIHPPARSIPVRFEWTRTEVRKRSVAGSAAMGVSSRGGVALHARAATDAVGRSSLRGSMDGRSAGHGISPSETEAATRDSVDALRPPTDRSGSRPSSLYASGGAQSPARASLDRNSALSTGEESDPEDCETKWACHLVLGPSTRIPIGSLAPTPHHPKLVAQLTVPYPLPDLSQSGLGADGAGLTREELKDIISVTALFVIVREAFGGLAKRRKGDSAIKFGAAVAQRP